MAAMWHRTMVYLGLKDDDEGYEYDYDELRRVRGRRAAAHAPSATRAGVEPRAATPRVAVEPRGRRAGPDGPRACPSTRHASRDEPPAIRPIRPIADELGARARRRARRLQRRPGGRRPPEGRPAGDPQPAGPRPRPPAAPDRLLERPHVRGRRHDGSASPTRCSCSRRATSRSPKRRRSGCRPAASTAPEPLTLPRDLPPVQLLLHLHRHAASGARSSRGSRPARARCGRRSATS